MNLFLEIYDMLEGREQCKILLIHPHPREIEKLFIKGVRKQIRPFKAYFGRKNDYSEINRRMAQSLLQIANE